MKGTFFFDNESINHFKREGTTTRDFSSLAQKPPQTWTKGEGEVRA